MKQKFFALCWAFLILFSIPMAAADQPCSLEVKYGEAGLTVSLWRVADRESNLVGDFAGLPVTIQGITSQTEWQAVAATLTAAITGDAIAPTATAVTDAEGNARFSDLETGLYLVGAVSGKREYQEALVYLPTPQEDGSLNYDMTIQPKGSDPIQGQEYSVIKLWRDHHCGHRPSSVTVDLYRDGIRQDTVTLSGANGWRHQWTDETGEGRWTVVERNVPAGYSVMVIPNGHVFVIVNTCPGHPEFPTEPPTEEPTVPTFPEPPTPPTEEPTVPPTEEPTVPPTEEPPVPPTEEPSKPTEEPTVPPTTKPVPPPSDVPQTGDTFAILPWVLVMCISGLLLVILGIWNKRRSK